MLLFYTNGMTLLIKNGTLSCLLHSRTCTRSGHPALWATDTYTEQEQFKEILQQLPSDVQLQLQLANIMSRAQRTFSQLGLGQLSTQQERTFDAVLQMLASQLDSIKPNESSGRLPIVFEGCLFD